MKMKCIKALNTNLLPGYRIIAFASKTLPTDSDILSTPRDTLESGLTFQGFLVLANRLKPETRVVVEELKLAGRFRGGSRFATVPCVSVVDFYV